MSCITITVGWGLSLQSLLRRRRLRSGEVLRLGKLEKMKSHISNIDDVQEVGGGGGGGGGTYVQSIKWGCPSCASYWGLLLKLKEPSTTASLVRVWLIFYNYLH